MSSGLKMPPRGNDPFVPESFRGYTRTLAFDTMRLNAIKGMLDSGLVERVEGHGVPCVVFTHDTLHPGIRRDDKTAVENYFRGALPFRTRLTRSGRVHRQLWESMRAEWRETGRLRLSLLEDLDDLMPPVAAADEKERAPGPRSAPRYFYSEGYADRRTNPGRGLNLFRIEN